MLFTYAKFKILPENLDKFMEIATEMVEKTRQEPGFTSYELVQGADDPTILAFVEKWADMDVLQIHFDTPHFKDLIPKMIALSAEEVSITSHNILV